jgi:hypothetical protein
MLAWRILRTLCATAVFSTAGFALYLVFTPAFLHWYGFANGLRQMLALAVMLSGLRLWLTPAPRFRSAFLHGAWFSAAVCYSPETGAAAVAGWAAAGLAGALGDPPGGRHSFDGRRTALLGAATGFLALLAGVLVFGCSGTVAERGGVMTETARQFLHGFMALPYLGGSMGRLIPAVLLASAAVWIARAVHGVSRGPDWSRHAALLVFGAAAFRGMLNRSDLPHVREAMPVVVILVTLHAESTWFSLRRIQSPRLRRWWSLSWGGAAAAIMLLTAVRIGDAIRGGAESVQRPNLLRSKSPTAFRISGDMRRAGLRVLVDAPRVGGLWLTPGQAGQMEWMMGEIAHRTRPDDPVFASPGAEVYYFLADRCAANSFPVSMHGVLPDDQVRIGTSLARCRIAMVESMTIDDLPWEWWLADVGRVFHREFSSAGHRGSLTLAVRQEP